MSDHQQQPATEDLRITTAFRFAAAEPWLITSEGLDRVLAVCARINLDVEMARTLRAAYDRRLTAIEDAPAVDQPAAVSARPLTRVEGKGKRLKKSGTVAVIPVYGTISRRGGSFDELSAMTTVDQIAEDFHIALNDPAFKAIVFDFDSPGGTAKGINELAQMIFTARGKKPCYAYVNGDCASAAYWLASACDAIVADETAVLGSIGVKMVAYGATPWRYTVIRSSRSPKKALELDTQEGREEAQKLVDALADVFIASVAKMRGVTEEEVEKDFGEGGVKVGKEAVAVGLADQLGSFEALIADLSAGREPGRSSRRRAAAALDGEPTMDTDKNTPAAPPSRQQKLVQVLKDVFHLGAESAAEEAGATATTALQPVVAQIGKVADPEAEQLRAELARREEENQQLQARLAERQTAEAAQRAAQIATDAQGYADKLLAGKTLPYETKSVVALVKAAAFVDAGDLTAAQAALKEGGQESCLATVKMLLEARGTHGLLEEKLDAAKHTVLPTEKSEAAQTAEEKQAAEAKTKKLLGMTSLGKQVLDFQAGAARTAAHTINR